MHACVCACDNRGLTAHLCMCVVAGCCVVPQPKVLGRMAKVLGAEHCSTPVFQRHMVRCVAAAMNVRQRACDMLHVFRTSLPMLTLIVDICQTAQLVGVVDGEGGIARLVALLKERVDTGVRPSKALILGNITKCIIVCTLDGALVGVSDLFLSRGNHASSVCSSSEHDRETRGGA